MIVQQTLKNLGFSENEAKIYLSSLETGVASAQSIAEKAKLKRTTTYSVLDGLVSKGFVLKVKEYGRNKFVAESPKNLIQIFNNYQKNLEQNLPQLEAIYNKKQTKPKVLFFEGKEGIKKIYQDTLDEKPEQILEWNTTEIFKYLPDFPKDYVKQRINKNIIARRIGPETNEYVQAQKKDAQELSQTKIIATEKYNPPIEINIYNNKVSFMSYEDEIGLIIESESIAKAMKQIYKIFWDKID